MKCYRCGAEAIWRVTTIDGDDGWDSCLSCLAIVSGEYAMLRKVTELKLTAIDMLGELA